MPQHHPLDDSTWRRLEPGTPPPRQRLRAMERLVAAGVNAGVLIAPVAPGITDSPRNLDALVAQAAAHGARFVGHAILRLQGSVKDHFQGFIRSDYPELLRRYAWLYPGAYAPSGYVARIADLMDEARARHGLATERDTGPAEPSPAPKPGEQLTLALAS